MPIPGSSQVQIGWGSELPDLVNGLSAHDF